MIKSLLNYFEKGFFCNEGVKLKHSFSIAKIRMIINYLYFVGILRNKIGDSEVKF